MKTKILFVIILVFIVSSLLISYLSFRNTYSEELADLKEHYKVLFNQDKYNGITFDSSLEESKYIDKWFYNQLTDVEKVYYQTIYHASINDETKIAFDFDLLEKRYDTGDFSINFYNARLAFLFDYPEYYYWFGSINSERKTNYNNEDRRYVYSINTFQNYYVYKFFNDKELVNKKANELIVELIGQTDYETLENIYKYIIEETIYDENYFEKDNLSTILLENRGVCKAQAELFQLLCDRANIECYCVTGYGEHDPDDLSDLLMLNDKEGHNFHRWNIVMLDNKWYWVDVTFGCLSYEHDGYHDESLEYTNFLVPDDIFLRNHHSVEIFNYPKCDDYSLYLCNGVGEIMDSFDQKKILDSLVNAQINGKDTYSFIFNNKEDCEECIKLLRRTSLKDVYSKITGKTSNYNDCLIIHAPNYSVCVRFINK